MKTNGISLCMIVKNEEQYLGDCLSSVKDLVNEIIIVDTGSDDKTIEIAKKFTNRIHHFKWCNDFAKARNESIKYAQYSWILYLDADERIDKKYHEKIKDFIKQNEFGAMVFKLKCYTDSEDKTKFYYSYYRRLFRNVTGVKFYGKVHEQVSTSLEDIGLKSCLADYEIEHLGYAAGKSVLDSKKERNLNLLLDHLNEDDNDWYSWHQLGSTYASMGEFDKAIEPLKKAIRMNGVSQSTIARSYNILSIISAEKSKYMLSQFYARESLKTAPNQNHAYFLKAEAYKKEENYLGAIRELEKALEFKFNNKNRIQQLTSDIVIDDWIIYKELAVNYYFLKNHKEAEKYFDKALENSTDKTPVILQKSLMFTELKKFKEADKLIESLKNKNEDYNLFKANNFKQSQEFDSAILFYKKYLESSIKTDKHLTAIISLAEIYHLSGKKDQRDKYIGLYLEEAKNIFPQESIILHELRLLNHLKQFKNNSFVFNLSNAFNKSDEQLAFFAQLYLEKNDYKNALIYLNKAIEINKKINYLVTRANIHLKLKELDRAEKYYYELCQILPGNSDIQKQYLKIKDLKSFH